MSKQEQLQDQACSRYRGPHYAIREHVKWTCGVALKVPTSGPSFEYWTPAEWIAPVRQVLGSIDLDPASCSEANKAVQADRYFTKQQDGLKQPWHARTLYMNPPYGGLVEPFTAKLVEEYTGGHIEAAIALLNGNNLDSPWWRPLWEDTLLCFTHDRIWFRQGVGQAPFGSVFILWGGDAYRQRFKRVFGELGTIAAKV